MSRNKLIQFAGVILLGFLITGCSRPGKKWMFQRSVSIDSVGQPISMLVEKGQWWISDAGDNRILVTDTLGHIIKQYPGFERPMHLAVQNRKVYVPEYLSDTVRVIQDGTVKPFPLKAEPDAPGGIAIENGTFAVADFYNHRVILQKGDKVRFIGKKGHKAGEFYYPTDVALFHDTLYVADAYNNRVQEFDSQGNHLRTIGEKDQLNIASGIAVNNSLIAVTDQGNNKVFLYDHKGHHKQTLSRYIDYPTDVFFDHHRLYITNFYKGTITVYELK